MGFWSVDFWTHPDMERIDVWRRLDRHLSHPYSDPFRVQLPQDYPWLSTRPGGCKCFEYVRKHGFRACAGVILWTCWWTCDAVILFFIFFSLFRLIHSSTCSCGHRYLQKRKLRNSSQREGFSEKLQCCSDWIHLTKGFRPVNVLSSFQVQVLGPSDFPPPNWSKQDQQD